MADVVDLEKTAPVKLLENRRQHLIDWLRQGEFTIADCEAKIAETKADALDILKELDELEKALNALNAAPKENETNV